jgi:hypothetical protein
MEGFGLIVGLIIAAFIAKWVYTDAVTRGNTNGMAWFWSIGTFLLLIVFLPLWFIFRPSQSVSPVVHTIAHEPKLCSACGKYYEGTPAFCPNCGSEI